jgi:hypothetical protein
VVLLVAGITANGLITLWLINTQHRQRVEFCRAEAEIRSKIADIEVQLHTYIYVVPYNFCR